MSGMRRKERNKAWEHWHAGCWWRWNHVDTKWWSPGSKIFHTWWKCKNVQWLKPRELYGLQNKFEWFVTTWCTCVPVIFATCNLLNPVCTHAWLKIKEMTIAQCRPGTIQNLQKRAADGIRTTIQTSRYYSGNSMTRRQHLHAERQMCQRSTEKF